MSYSIAQMHLDTAIHQYERQNYRQALVLLNKAKEEFKDDPVKTVTISKYIKFCLSNLPGR